MTIPLPPLPHIAGDEEGYRPGGRSVLDVLTEEHQRLRGLRAELAQRGVAEPRRRELLDLLAAEISRHLSAEEQYLFPAVRAALPEATPIADEELAKNEAILRTLRDLTDANTDDSGWVTLAGRLGELLDQHAKQIDGVILPGLGEVADAAELIRLGNRVEIAKEAAPTRPHPDSPSAPPLNRMVEPAIGVVDKIRDAMTGRRTYPEDV